MTNPEFTSKNALGRRVRRTCKARGITMRQAGNEAGFGDCTPNFFNCIAGRFGTTRGTSRDRVVAWLNKWEARSP